MAEQKSFKERVKDTVIQNANSYKRYFVDYEYLLCSEAFVEYEQGGSDRAEYGAHLLKNLEKQISENGLNITLFKAL